jgi:hypothetical protein
MKASAMRPLLTTLAPAQENVLIVGPPGIGKSDLVEQVASDLDVPLLITHPVVDDPTDYKGMPAIVDRNGAKAAEFLPFGDLWKIIDAQEPTLVFMDDLGQAPPAVQAAIMQLILARRINGHAVSKHVSFVAATNRKQDRAAVSGLIAPLLDRFTAVLHLEFDLDDWVTWGLSHSMPPELLAFVRFKPDLMAGGVRPESTGEDAGSGTNGRSGNARRAPTQDAMAKTPTPRSVAGLGRLVNMGLLDPELLGGTAGSAFATEFVAFYNTWMSIPDRMQIYLNPDTTEVPGLNRPDVLYALMGSLAYGAEPGNMEQTVRFLRRVPPEYAVLCIKDAAQRTPAVANTRAFIEWVTANSRIFGNN